MKFATLDYDQAHAVVNRNHFLRWDGWDIVTWRKDPKGFTNARGEFRSGSWGITFRYPLQDNGTWKVPQNYVDYAVR